MAFGQDRRNSPMRKAEKKIARLEQKLRQKDGVLAEPMSEYVAVEKSLGED